MFCLMMALDEMLTLTGGHARVHQFSIADTAIPRATRPVGLQITQPQVMLYKASHGH